MTGESTETNTRLTSLELDPLTDLELSPEERIVLFASRTAPPLNIIESTLRLHRKILQYKKLCELAIGNGVGSFLYLAIKDLDEIPDGVMEKLRNVYLSAAAANTLVSEEIRNVLGYFSEAGIDIIPLRGTVAADLVFGDPGLYPPGDIDVLIRPRDFDAARQVLINHKYTPTGDRERDMLASHYHVVFSADRSHIEVHWNLAKRYFPIPPEFWWEETRTAQFNGLDILTLSPERYILSSVFRLFSHQFVPLKFVVLLAELINKYQEVVDWKKLVSLADKYRMKRLLLFSLYLASKLLGSHIPGDLRAVPIWGRTVLRNAVLRNLFRQSGRAQLRKIIFTLALESPQEAIIQMLRRFYPESGELRLRYHIQPGSKKIYLYYVLNPVLLPLLLLKKKGEGN